jgi:hypothetical protein
MSFDVGSSAFIAAFDSDGSSDNRFGCFGIPHISGYFFRGIVVGEKRDSDRTKKEQ